jgi:hypothetical protein
VDEYAPTGLQFVAFRSTEAACFRGAKGGASVRIVFSMRVGNSQVLTGHEVAFADALDELRKSREFALREKVFFKSQLFAASALRTALFLNSRRFSLKPGQRF